MTAILHRLGDGLANTAFALAGDCEFSTEYTRELLTELRGSGLVSEEDRDFDGTWYRLTQAGRTVQAKRAAKVASAKSLTESHGPGLLISDRETTHKEPKMTASRKASAQAAADATVSLTSFDTCLCGCGQTTGPKSMFKQGHDARLVSLTVYATVYGTADMPSVVLPDDYNEQGDIQWRIDLVAEHIKRTLGDKLANKFFNAAMNGWDKAVRSKNGLDAPAPVNTADQRQPEPTIEGAEPVKVGRWTYPARRVDGHLERNTKRDGSGEWIKAGVK